MLEMHKNCTSCFLDFTFSLNWDLPWIHRSTNEPMWALFELTIDWYMSKVMFSVTMVTNKCIDRLLENWHWNYWVLDCYYLSKYMYRFGTVLKVPYRVSYNFQYTLIHLFQRIVGISWIMFSWWQYDLVRSLYGTVP